MIRLENISYKINDKYILKNINLEIQRGKLTVLTGPNGSGKTTLLKIIMGIVNPTSGKIYFDNKEITKLKINERSNLGISFAYQIPISFKGITIYEMLCIASGKLLSFDEAKKILSQVGLCTRNYIQREFSSSLSGGELKRIEIAMAIIKEKKFLIFDEPEAGIDLWTYNDLLNIFKNEKRRKKTMLIISHQEKMLNLADKIIILKNGTLEKEENKVKTLLNLKIKGSIKKCGGENCE